MTLLYFYCVLHKNNVLNGAERENGLADPLHYNRIKQNVVKAIKAVARGQNRYVSKLRELTFESS